MSARQAAISVVNNAMWAATVMWALVWTWVYPLARLTLHETLVAEQRATSPLARSLQLLMLCVRLPGLARSQDTEERHHATRTRGGDAWPVEPRWRGRLRESIVWLTVAGWTTASGAVVTSVIATGNFLFESHASPEAPGIVSNYFRVAAVSGMLPVAIGISALLLLKMTRRAVA